MRHNLTREEVKRIHDAPTLLDAEGVAIQIEQGRMRADRAGRCYWHDRVDCARCKNLKEDVVRTVNAQKP